MTKRTTKSFLHNSRYNLETYLVVPEYRLSQSVVDVGQDKDNVDSSILSIELLEQGLLVVLGGFGNGGVVASDCEDGRYCRDGFFF